MRGRRAAGWLAGSWENGSVSMGGCSLALVCWFRVCLRVCVSWPGLRFWYFTIEEGLNERSCLDACVRRSARSLALGLALARPGTPGRTRPPARVRGRPLTRAVGRTALVWSAVLARLRGPMGRLGLCGSGRARPLKDRLHYKRASFRVWCRRLEETRPL